MVFDKAKVNTTLGFIFKEEVVMVALDHASIPPDGAFPENAIAPHPHLLAAISGGSKGSRREYLHYLQNKCDEYEREAGRKASAAEATKWMGDLVSRNLCHRDGDDDDDDDDLPKLIFGGCDHSYSGDDLPYAILIAGWDKELGPSLYQVDVKGKIWKHPVLSAGCGSDGLAIITWPHKHLSMDDAVEMTEKALCLSVYPYREACECVTVFQVGVEGVKPVIFNRDIGEWQKHYFTENPDKKCVYDQLKKLVERNFTAILIKSPVFTAGGSEGATKILGSNPATPAWNQIAMQSFAAPPAAAKIRYSSKFNKVGGCSFGDKGHFGYPSWESKHMRPTGVGQEGDDHGAEPFAVEYETTRIVIEPSHVETISMNSKHICGVTGVKLAIKDSESYGDLKILELQGSSDQLVQAIKMVQGLFWN